PTIADLALVGIELWKRVLSGGNLGTGCSGFTGDCQSHSPDSDVYYFRTQLCRRRDFLLLPDCAGAALYLDPCHRQPVRSEEHTSELQSRENLVCRLLLEK